MEDVALGSFFTSRRLTEPSVVGVELRVNEVKRSRQRKQDGGNQKEVEK